jgi:HAD superfamily hydrolase (TIGR01509 family)
MTVAVLDIDGTLVDTNYHHTLAWYRAFRQHEIPLSLWRIHRHLGMGGDQLVAAVAGERIEEEQGDDIRAAENVLYLELIDEVEPMAGARELIEQLRRRRHTVVLASSAKADEVDHYLDLLDVRELVDGWTTSADVESTKPAPDLVQAALERVGGSPDDAVMVGDTTWDVQGRRAHARGPHRRVRRRRAREGRRGGGVRVRYRAVREARRDAAALTVSTRAAPRSPHARSIATPSPTIWPTVSPW